MKTIGIIGGMGPEAALDLHGKILACQKAKKDQDYIPVLLYNNSQIPDRSAYLLEEGKDPRPEIIRTGKALEKAGADLLLMSCNTAHYFYKDLAKHFQIPLLHMIEITAKEAKKQEGEFLLLATQGTYRSEIYTDAFEKEGLSLALPDPALRQDIMRWIYMVKGQKLKEAAREFAEIFDREKRTLVLGCTELPLIVEATKKSFPHLDPTLLLAREAVHLAK